MLGRRRRGKSTASVNSDRHRLLHHLQKAGPTNQLPVSVVIDLVAFEQ